MGQENRMSDGGDDSTRLVTAFLDICASPEDLKYPGGFRDSGLAVISAVFSIQAKDASVRKVVARFAAAHGLDVAALDQRDPGDDLYPVERLSAELEGRSTQELVSDVFGSAAKSPRSGRTKAELVKEVSSALVDVGVRSRADVELQPSGERYAVQKQAWTDVAGLGWVTFEYFRLLCGAETAKPDVMIHRWLTRTLGRTSDGPSALEHIRALSAVLASRWGQSVSTRAVDHTIWFHESERAESA
jgi:hypothetical protein